MTTTFGHQHKLAVSILSEQFGEQVAQVGETLLHKGRLSVHQIVNYGRLDADIVKKSLLILLHHNCVEEKVEFKERPKRDSEGQTKQSERALFTFYEAVLENILIRIRFPRFIAFIKEKYGNEGEMLTEEVLEHGRTTKQQAVKQCADLANQIIGATLPREEKSKEVEFNEVFSKLIRDSYLVQADLPLHTSESTDESNLNPSFTSSSMLLDRGDDNSNWRLNYDRFNIQFRNEAIVDYVKEKFGGIAAYVIQTAFVLVEPYMKSLEETQTAPFGVDKLLQKMQENPTDVVSGDMDIAASSSGPEFEHEVVSYLNVMSKGNVCIVTRVSGDGAQATYAINLETCMTAIKNRLVESIVHQKFGNISARIFRLLVHKKFLEQKQIGALAMIPIKEARDRLYKMFSSGYVQLQEVPKSQDHAPARTFYLWGVKMESLYGMLVAEMYKTIDNIKIRLRYQLDQAAGVIARAEEVQQHEGATLTDAEKEELEKIQKIEDQLENSVLQVDKTLLLLKC